MEIEYFYDKINQNDALLTYQGHITEDLILSILGRLRSAMDNRKEKLELCTKVYMVLVELLQNIYRHASAPLLEANINGMDKAFFQITKEKNYYKVVTGNYISNNIVPEFKKRMNEINSLSPEEVKEQYKMILLNSQLSEKGGAGLGMLEITRKSGNPLLYEFTPVNNHFSFFTLNVRIE